jgi:dCMP deaminase
MTALARIFFENLVKGKYNRSNRDTKIDQILDLKKDRYDKAYMRMAIEWSKLSYCSRAKVGSLIVKDGMIISDGFNGSPTGFNNDCEDVNNETYWYIIHSEANAILKCAKNGSSAKDATLYITHSPCKDCAKMIHQSGIKRVVYNEKYRDNEGINFLENSGLEVIFLNNNLD